jgi:putative FmdB family regulatory protein
MPVYQYEHSEGAESCPRGKAFTVSQRMADDALEICPDCQGPVERLISSTYVSAPTADTDLRDKGFAKLVKRDKGVYENVTALDGESKIWDANKPGTMPDIKRRISD